MTSSIQGPSLFIAQGWGKAGWTTLKECAASAAALGYKGLQVPLWGGGPIDTELASRSVEYCQEQQGIATEAGCPIVELANHVEGQFVRCSPAFRPLFRGMAPKNLQDNWSAIEQWAKGCMKSSIAAAHNFGFKHLAAFPGTSIFHTFYEWPQRPKGLVNAAFNALASAWMPILEVAEDSDVDLAFELHPMEDLMDGSTFDRFKRHLGRRSKRAKILVDLSHRAVAGSSGENMLAFIRSHARDISMFHVKDGEFTPTSESDAYGSYLPWNQRPGCFRSTGDGMIPYQQVFDLMGRELQLGGLWATVEWEDCRGKGWAQGVRESVHFVNAWLNQTKVPARTPAEASGETFDDFVGGGEENPALLAEILGIPVEEVNTKAAA